MERFSHNTVFTRGSVSPIKKTICSLGEDDIISYSQLKTLKIINC